MVALTPLRPGPLLATLALLVLAVTPAQGAEAIPAKSGTVDRYLGQGWVFLEAGSLRKAELAFQEAKQAPGGISTAEVYYALSAIRWEQRNAMAAHAWLLEAQEKQGSGDWDSGEDNHWDRRIQGRLRWIERNFAAIKLRSPPIGKPLPPMADPLPRDPLLKSFAEAAPERVSSAADEGVTVQWLFLPRGTWWVGDELVTVEPGNLEPTRAVSWDLPRDVGGPRRRMGKRSKAQRDGLSMAQAVLAELDAEQAKVVAAQAAADRVTAAAIDAPRSAWVFPLVMNSSVSTVLDALHERWFGDTFQIRYLYRCVEDDDEHQFAFPDQGFYVRVDQGGVLKIKGSSKLSEELGSDWRCGESAPPNSIELLYDGTDLTAMVNGLQFGPVEVRAAGGQPLAIWELEIAAEGSVMEDLSIGLLRR